MCVLRNERIFVILKNYLKVFIVEETFLILGLTFLFQGQKESH